MTAAAARMGRAQSIRETATLNGFLDTGFQPGTLQIEVLNHRHVTVHLH
jgi:hypothetical protein